MKNNKKRGIFFILIVFMIILMCFLFNAATFNENQIYSSPKVLSLPLNTKFKADVLTGTKLCELLTDGNEPILVSFGYPYGFASNICSSKSLSFFNGGWNTQSACRPGNTQSRPYIAYLECRAKNTGESSPLEFIPYIGNNQYTKVYNPVWSGTPPPDPSIVLADVRTSTKLCEMNDVNFPILVNIIDSHGDFTCSNYFYYWTGTSWSTINRCYSANIYESYARIEGGANKGIICGKSLCTLKTCVDYPGECGSSLSNGCTGTIDCSNNCPLGEMCESKICVPQIQECPENQIIMKLYKPYNSYSALWNYTNYRYSICYDKIFGKSYDKANPHKCNGKNEILRLKDANNSLAEISGLSNYNVPVCFGDLECKYVKENRSLLNYLVAYYPFDGNFNDASGNENHGSADQTPTYTSSGKYGGAYSFNGIDNYVSVYNKESLNFNNSISITAWVMPNNFPNDFISYQAIIASYTNPDNHRFQFYLSPDGGLGSLGGHISHDGTAGFGAEGVGRGLIIPREWSFVSFVYNINSKTISYYINGEKKGDYNTGVSGLFINNKGFLIGARQIETNSIDSFFDGTIDEIKIFNTSLSADEIKRVYENFSLAGNQVNCSTDEKPVLRLENKTGSRISNASDNSHEIKICCKEIVVTGNAYWENMNGIPIIGANLSDSVKLIVNGSEFQGKEINYTIWKDRAFWFDKKVAQSSTRGQTVWIANETGEFYFKAKIDNTEISSHGQPFGDLKIIGYFNSLPSATIINPVNETKYIINEATGKTGIIDFNQTSSDEDDDLNISWNFGDGNITKFKDCLSGNNCNATHEYISSGTKIITLTAHEKTRNQQAVDYSRVYVYKKGLNIFAVIDSPNYKEPVKDAGNFLISGTSSHVADCYGTENECNAALARGTKTCYKINDTRDINNYLWCYRLKEANELVFRWTFDGVVDTGNITSATFTKTFIESKEHVINLKVTYNY